MSNHNNKIMWIVLAMMCVGIVVRLIGFGDLPAGINRDEAALGYNAYSLLQSGKDEWGMSWPIVFRSFGDYKLAGYIYTLIPFISMFGNTAFAVRIPSLLAGITLIPLAYLFTYEVVRRKDVAFIAACVQALSPWALHYSKVGFEANLALALFVAGLYFCIKRNASTLQSIIGVILLFISLLTYNAPLVLIPFIFLTLLAMKKMKLALIVAVLSVCAFVLVYPATKGKTGITVFTDIGVVEQQHQEYLDSGKYFIKRVLSYPILYYPRVIAVQYIKSFDPMFLVFKGGSNPWHQAPQSGHLTLSMYILFVLGVLSAATVLKKQAILLYVFLLIGPLASAITVDAPQATRMLFFLFMSGIFASIGLLAVWRYMKLIAVLACIIVIAESVQHQYNAYRSFLTVPQAEWYSGMSVALQKAESYRKDSELIGIIGDVHYLYVYPAYFEKISPAEFHSTIEYFPNDLIGLSQVKKVGHYQFASSKENLQNVSILIEQRDGQIHVDRSNN